MFACAGEGAPLALVGGLLAICPVSAGPVVAGARTSPACPAAASGDAVPATCPWGGPVPPCPAPSCPPTTASVPGPAGTSGSVRVGAASTALLASSPVPSGRCRCHDGAAEGLCGSAAGVRRSATR